ncbi:hypothetical protein PsorP6_015348 [Peronosclerospora sorghi]|uniref:Uncharacterized protein n=1 Tax=Peronosclerospora sorghi TaxID=230839 RepID=A0ACC0VU99_9STRA|nr:hypothetical protein PsorP6_015348 [Peronosclerospora sorghi]
MATTSASEAALSNLEPLQTTLSEKQGKYVMDTAPSLSATTDCNARFVAVEEADNRIDAELDQMLLETLTSTLGHDDDDAPSLVAALDGSTCMVPLGQILPSPPLPMENGPDVSGQTRSSSRRPKDLMSNISNLRRRIKVNPNRARDERKHELAYLRNKVEQMEREVEMLHHRRHVKGISSDEALDASLDSEPKSLATSSVKPSSKMLLVWRDIATRQQQRQKKAARENATLKLVLESHAQLAKSLEMLLQKRARQQVSGCAEVVGFNGNLSTKGCTLNYLLDKDTFEALLMSVETAYAELDIVFSINGLLKLDTPCRDARMREGYNSMYLDVFANNVLPFSYEAVTSAVWNHFKGNEKYCGVVYDNARKFVGSSLDSIIEAFMIELVSKTATADFCVKQVIRRYIENDRQVVVWVSIKRTPDSTNSIFSSFGFIEKGYVVTRRPVSISSGQEVFTILQMCSLVSPQTAAGSRIDMTAASDFTEFVLNVVAANTTMNQEIIENVLLDQALNMCQVDETNLAF